MLGPILKYKAEGSTKGTTFKKKPFIVTNPAHLIMDKKILPQTDREHGTKIKLT